jgi:hypothetical protein
VYVFGESKSGGNRWVDYADTVSVVDDVVTTKFVIFFDFVSLTTMDIYQ